ncbi:MAG TPA: ATP synthase F0 subunit C [Thermoanaerobaculia bacterium]|nr:ATP synthase F0 subunit C [Thermoanaerobaculia bacterium]HMF08336.1 ATP synthase F0 subunit C [Thermoanaerobaculia bacterium]
MTTKKVFVLVALLACVALPALAQETAGGGVAPSGVRWGAIGAAFLLGIAAAAGAIGQGRATSAAADGISRNPGAAGAIRTMTIIGLALIESLVLYALLIAFLIRNL